MSLTVRAQPSGFGARVVGIDLQQAQDEATIADLRAAWLEHRVVCFPEQPMNHAQLERFTRYFGEFGDDPYVESLAGHKHILEVRREPDETPQPFGASWHSDWSFQSSPPSATILHAKIIPPYGGNTLYADGVLAYEALSESLKTELEELTAIHSARRPYSHEGYERSGGRARSMRILPNDDAWKTQQHPVVRTHPETGRKALWVNPVYTISIEDMSNEASDALLKRLFDHALQDRFIYEHKWSPDMLTMWDNRAVQHCAQGGYDGHRRVMHRTIVAGDMPH